MNDLPLYEVVYMSVCDKSISSDQFASILEQSQSNNTRNGVSGILVYFNTSRQFAQLIEGTESLVTQTLERIKRDARHSRVHVLWEGPKAERSFSDWKMNALLDADSETDMAAKYGWLEQLFEQTTVKSRGVTVMASICESIRKQE